MVLHGMFASGHLHTDVRVEACVIGVSAGKKRRDDKNWTVLSLAIRPPTIVFRSRAGFRSAKALRLGKWEWTVITRLPAWCPHAGVRQIGKWLSKLTHHEKQAGLMSLIFSWTIDAIIELKCYVIHL